MIVTIDMICLRLAPKGIETLLVKRSNPNRLIAVFGRFPVVGCLMRISAHKVANR